MAQYYSAAGPQRPVAGPYSKVSAQYGMLAQLVIRLAQATRPNRANTGRYPVPAPHRQAAITPPTSHPHTPALLASKNHTKISMGFATHYPRKYYCRWYLCCLWCCCQCCGRFCSRCCCYSRYLILPRVLYLGTLGAPVARPTAPPPRPVWSDPPAPGTHERASEGEPDLPSPCCDPEEGGGAGSRAWISQMCRCRPAVAAQSRVGTNDTRPARRVQPTCADARRQGSGHS